MQGSAGGAGTPQACLSPTLCPMARVRSQPFSKIWVRPWPCGLRESESVRAPSARELSWLSSIFFDVLAFWASCRLQSSIRAASKGRDWLRARWLPSHVPDCVLLASFVADCVFIGLAPKRRRHKMCIVFERSKFIATWPSPPFSNQKNGIRKSFWMSSSLPFLYEDALFLVKFL